MSPRPRTASDEDILAATYRVISRVGPRFTLADVAKEIGLSPATLIQRFRSKKGLMLALFSSASNGTDNQWASIRENAAGPLDAVFALADCFAQMATTAEELANHLAFLQMDLTDPDMHELALAQAKAMRAELRALLDAAIAARELRADTDAARLANAIQSMQGGSLTSRSCESTNCAGRPPRRSSESICRERRTSSPTSPTAVDS